MRRYSAVLGAILTMVLVTTVVQPSVASPPVSDSLSKSAAATSSPSYATDESEDFDVEEAELVESTTSTNIYETDDGFMVTEFSDVPLNVLDDSGGWVPISTDVEVIGDSASVANHPLTPVFAEFADDSAVLSVSARDETLTFELIGAAASELIAETPTVDSNEVVYHDVFSATDLRYEILPGAVKETLVLDSAPSSQPTFAWIVRGEGLLGEVTPINSVKFSTPGGEAVFEIPLPEMWDSSGEAGVREPARATIDPVLAEIGPGEWRFELRPNLAWLTSPEIEYPVFVDPTISESNLDDSTIKSWKSDGYGPVTYSNIGNTRESNTDKYWRTYVRYPIASVFGKQVWSVRLHGSYDNFGTTSCKTGGVYTQTSTSNFDGGTNTKKASLQICSGGGDAVHTDLSQLYSDWVQAGTEKSVQIRGKETAGEYSYKRVTSRLYVKWKSFPSVASINSPSPSNGASDVTTLPSFKATGSSPAGFALEYRYLLSTSSNPLSSATVTTAWASVPEQQLVAALAPSTTYYWVAQVREPEAEGRFGVTTVRSSSVRSFTTSNVPVESPTLPRELAVDPWDEPDDTGLVTSLEPSFSAVSNDPDGDDISLHFEAYTDPSLSSASLAGSCASDVVGSGDPAECTLTSRVPVGKFYVRSKASDGINESEWTSPTTFTASARMMAYVLAEQVFDSADPDAALAALPSADQDLLVEYGVLGDEADEPTAADTAASDLAMESWEAVDANELTFEESEFVEELSDVGSLSAIEDVKSAVPSLIAADTEVGRLTFDSANNPSDPLSSEAAEQRLEQLEEIWVADQVGEEAEAWDAGLEIVSEDPQYEPYVDNTFVVTSWVGVQIDGNTAHAVLLGHQELSPITGETRVAVDEQYQVGLERVSSSANWQLAEVTRVVDNSDWESNREFEIPTAAGASSPGDFVRADAVNYARKYSCNLTVTVVRQDWPGMCANKTYKYVLGGDCTNFVSQALFSAGMDRRVNFGFVQENTHYWWWTNGLGSSRSWKYVLDFSEFMVENSKRATLNRIPNSHLSNRYSGVQAGDVYLVDLTGKGISHAMIALGNGKFANYYDKSNKAYYRDWGASGSKIAQHTTDRVDAPWNWAYRISTPKDRAKLKYYVLHFTGGGDY
jgi:hypothetical protein